MNATGDPKIPNSPSWNAQARHVQLLARLAAVEGALGNTERAEECVEQASGLAHRALGEGHPALGLVHETAGTLARARGDQPRAEQCLRLARDVYGAASSWAHLDVARVTSLLAEAKRLAGHQQLALDLHGAAARIVQGTVGEGHPVAADIQHSWGVTLTTSGDTAAARQCYDRSLGLRLRVTGREHPGIADTMVNWGTLLLDAGEPSEAQRLFAAAMDIRLGLFGPERDLPAAFRRALLARALDQLGRLEEALAEYSAVVHIKVRENCANTVTNAVSLNDMGDVCRRLGRLDSALECFERGLHIVRSVVGAHTLEAASFLASIAAVHEDEALLAAPFVPPDSSAESDAMRKATECLHECLSLRESYLPPDHPLLAETRQNIQRVAAAQAPLSDP